MNASREEAGGIVGGWLVKVTIPLVLIGVVLIDLASIGLAHFTAHDQAVKAGIEASETVTSVNGLVTPEAVLSAYSTANAVVERDGSFVSKDDFVVYPDGRVTLTVQKNPNTFLVRRIPPLRQFTEISATVTVNRPKI